MLFNKGGVVMGFRKLAVIILVLGCVLTAVGAAAARGQSTPEERRLFVELTALLEQKPLSDQAGNIRSYLFAWLSEVPDIAVVACMGPITPIMEADYDQQYAAALVIQPLFGQAAYLIGNPAVGGDSPAAQTAGIESMLRMYEFMLTQGVPRLSFLDDLLEKQQAGTLEQWVGEQTASCKASDS
jgi:hypothetical protein